MLIRSVNHHLYIDYVTKVRRQKLEFNRIIDRRFLVSRCISTCLAATCLAATSVSLNFPFVYRLFLLGSLVAPEIQDYELSDKCVTFCLSSFFFFFRRGWEFTLFNIFFVSGNILVAREIENYEFINHRYLSFPRYNLVK